ncbi:hypothetical protein BKA65DRAFT_544949 [Rhexocercosporidium sp. MPI-PUGE-AT-0058]|nr:hypothetical protein BKA65DRAFT_544949 [Rhexocercosporidium sp. MPI-PUGE-AT-0058]
MESQLSDFQTLYTGFEALFPLIAYTNDESESPFLEDQKITWTEEEKAAIDLFHGIKVKGVIYHYPLPLTRSTDGDDLADIVRIQYRKSIDGWVVDKRVHGTNIGQDLISEHTFINARRKGPTSTHGPELEQRSEASQEISGPSLFIHALNNVGRAPARTAAPTSAQEDMDKEDEHPMTALELAARVTSAAQSGYWERPVGTFNPNSSLHESRMDFDRCRLGHRQVHLLPTAPSGDSKDDMGEIRKVWKEEIKFGDEQQVYELEGYIVPKTTWNMPVILQICQLARFVGLKSYVLAFGAPAEAVKATKKIDFVNTNKGGTRGEVMVSNRLYWPAFDAPASSPQTYINWDKDTVSYTIGAYDPNSFGNMMTASSF